MSEEQQRTLVVDGRNHVAGKLASHVAKKLLEGYKVAVVCCEDVILNGDMHRHVGKYRSYLNKRCVVNPARGPFHYKEPSKYFFKILRGNIKRKTSRGREALSRLELFESIPRGLLGKERHVFPLALHKQTNKTEKKCITLGQLLSKFGWKYAKLAEEFTRKINEAEFESKQSENERNEKAKEYQKTKEFNEIFSSKLSEYY